MVFTPYPRANDRFENPTLRASRDGLAWIRPEGISDPIVLAPDKPEFHHADPELVFHAGRIYIIYATIRRGFGDVTFSSVSADNDLKWTHPKSFHTDKGALSPTCDMKGERWHLWFIRGSKNAEQSELLHREGASLNELGSEDACELQIPQYVPWHIDIRKFGRDYEALVAAYPVHTDSSRTRLFHVKSSDGRVFSLGSSEPILRPSRVGWDNRMIYRSTFLKEGERYRIWYSAASWSLHFGIGYLSGSLNRLHEDRQSRVAPLPSSFLRLTDDLFSYLVYETYHCKLRFMGRLRRKKLHV